MFKVSTYNRNYLDPWNMRMMRCVDDPLVDKVIVAILKQQGLREIKYEPRNMYHPDAIYETLKGFDPDNSHFIDLSDYNVKQGLNMTWKCFSRPQSQPLLHPVRLDGQLGEVFKLLKLKGEKSAGLTAYGESKAEAFPVAMRKVDRLMKAYMARKVIQFVDPCLALTRTQAFKWGRLVWGYPLMMTIIEGSIARPILDKFVDIGSTPMSFGKTSSVIGSDMRKAASFNKNYVSIDSSKFDSTIQAGIIKFAFSCLKTWFDLEEKVYYDINVGDIFDIVENYFINTPIVMPSEKGPRLYKGKRHGVPSGSYFTQLVDSVANVVFVGSLSSKYQLGIRSEELFVLGDDVLFYTNKPVNKIKIKEWSQYLNSTFYIKVNERKTKFGASDTPTPYLGREWSNGLPYREFSNVVERAVSPENYRRYKDKAKEAQLVLASYMYTAIIRNVPYNIILNRGIDGYLITENLSSGLVQFMLSEGQVTQRFTPALF